MLQIAAHALRDVDHRMAVVADDALRARELHLQRGAAARAFDAARLERLLAAFGQPVIASSLIATERPMDHLARPGRRSPACRPRRACCAHRRRRSRVRDSARRQLALRRDQLGGGDRGHGPGLPGDADRLARRSVSRCRHGRPAARRRRRRVAAVVLAQPAGASVVEQRMPLVPGAPRRSGTAAGRPARRARPGGGRPRRAAAASGRRTARRPADALQRPRRRARCSNGSSCRRRRPTRPSGTRPARRSSGRRPGSRVALCLRWPRQRGDQTSFFSSSAFLASNSSPVRMPWPSARRASRGRHHLVGPHTGRLRRRGSTSRAVRPAGPG